MSVCSLLPWLLSRHWLQGTLGNRSSPVNKRRRFHEGEWGEQEGGRVGQGVHDNEGSRCIYLHYGRHIKHVNIHEFGMRDRCWNIFHPPLFLPNLLCTSATFLHFWWIEYLYLLDSLKKRKFYIKSTIFRLPITSYPNFLQSDSAYQADTTPKVPHRNLFEQHTHTLAHTQGEEQKA